MTFSELLKLLKEVGVVRVGKSVSFLAWLFLPFLIWVILTQFAGNEFFVLNLAIPGLVIFFVTSIFYTLQIYWSESQEFKVMKLIEKTAAALISDPKNKEKAEKFKSECRKFTLAYGHRMPFSLSALPELLKPVPLIINIISSFYMSYSITAFVVTFQTEIINLLGGLAFIATRILPSTVTQILHSQLIEWPTHNLWMSLVIFWILSLYYDPITTFMREERFAVPKDRGILAHLTSLYNLSLRIIMAVSQLLLIPITVVKRRRGVECDPFIDPLTLPQIVQKTVQNVEGRSCDVSRWGEKIETEADVDRIKRLTLSDKTTPSLMKIMAGISSSKDALRKIKETQPITYLGIHDSRCVFLGIVMYNPIERIRQGRFYFDTTYLKKEFLLIYAEEVEKQRRIERKLPSKLEELIERLE